MKLHAVFCDTLRTYMAIEFENESLPYGRRLVTVDLTDEQAEALRPRVSGKRNGKEWLEELGPVWLERDGNSIEGET